MVAAIQQGRPKPLQMKIQAGFEPLLVHSIDARRAGAARRQHDPGCLGQPDPVGDEPHQPIEPAGPIGRGPGRKLVLHVTDYQRSSPCSVRSCARASHSNCFPSPCDRLSRPRTTPEALPACRTSGPTPLPFRHAFPRSYVGLQTYRRGCRSQSFPLHSASRCRRRGLAAFSPRLPARRLTCPPAFAVSRLTFPATPSAFRLLSHVGGGDIPALRRG